MLATGAQFPWCETKDSYSVKYECGVESKKSKRDMSRASFVVALLHNKLSAR